MRDAIELKSKEVPEFLKAGYKGRKFRLHICETVEIPADANLWSGGSKDSYSAIELETGRAVTLGSTGAPWAPGRENKTIRLVPGIVVKMHSYFCGKDTGLTFYAHEDNVRKFLNGPAKGDF
jgi:hypothetical protein